MSARELTSARQAREEALAQLKALHREMQELAEMGEVNPGGIEVKKGQFLEAHGEALDAHVALIILEETSADDEANSAWQIRELEQPYHQLMEIVDRALEGVRDAEDEREVNAEKGKAKKKLKCRLTELEADLTGGVDAVTTCAMEVGDRKWQVANHAAMVNTVRQLDQKFRGEHVEVGEQYLDLLEDAEATMEEGRQETFRTDLRGKLAAFKARLQTVTPVAQQVQAPPVPDASQANPGVATRPVPQPRTKLKMAAMAVPEFSNEAMSKVGTDGLQGDEARAEEFKEMQEDLRQTVAQVFEQEDSEDSKQGASKAHEQQAPDYLKQEAFKVFDGEGLEDMEQGASKGFEQEVAMDTQEHEMLAEAGTSTGAAKSAGELKHLIIEDLNGMPVIRERAAETVRNEMEASLESETVKEVEMDGRVHVKDDGARVANGEFGAEVADKDEGARVAKEMFEVDMDHVDKDTVGVGDIPDYNGCSQDELLGAKREAVANEKLSVAMLNPVTVREAVDVITNVTEAVDMLTDDELYRVDQDYGVRNVAVVGDIRGYRGYSREELLEVKREAVAREKVRKQKISVAVLDSVINKDAVDLITGELEADDLITGDTEAGNETSNIAYETVEELLQQHETQLNDVSHVEARGKLVSNYKASLTKQRHGIINNSTIIARLNHVSQLEKLWTRLFEESARMV